VRSPVLPNQRLLAVVLGSLGLIMAVAQASFRSQVVGHFGLSFGTWLVLNCLAFLAPVVGLGLLGRAGLTAIARVELRWAAYWVALLVPTALACWVRAQLAVSWCGVPPSPYLLVGTFFWVWLPIYYLEREAAMREDHQLHRAAIEDEIQQLFLSRASLLEARASTTYDVVSLLEGRFGKHLKAVEAQLERFVAAGTVPGDGVLASLQDEIDHLADAQVRQISHNLHPSVIKMGLLPALRSLVGRYPQAFTIVGEGLAGPEADGPDAALQLTAYRVVEAALDSLARHVEGASATVTPRIVSPGELVVAVAGRDVRRAIADSHVQREVIDSRVRLAGGRWAFEGADELRAYFPLTGA
jgi:signal transduction histidine kinase